MKEVKKIYIGPRGVDNVVILDDIKTYGDKEVVKVNYDGGYSEIMTKKSYELLCSEEPSDFTKVRDKKIKEMLKELYPLFGKFISSFDNEENLQERKKEFLQASISLISEYNLKESEINALLEPMIAQSTITINSLANELDNMFNRATNYLWTKDDSQFIPGSNIMMERTILEAKKVNESIPEQKNNKK